MSENKSPIDKEPIANGNGKLGIELPNNEKKEVEVIVKNNTIINQIGPKKKKVSNKFCFSFFKIIKFYFYYCKNRSIELLKNIMEQVVVFK